MLRLLALPAALTFFTANAAALALPQLNNLESRSLTLTLPSSGLPTPSTISPGVSLKYIALGVGTQNYTCATTPNSASAPAQVGAAATLYDAGQFFQSLSGLVPSLPSFALGLYTMTGADMTSAIGTAVLGHHFFNGVGQPTFDLTKVNALLTSKKINSVAAPAGACPGPNNAGAVSWLQLTDIGGGASFGGVSYVYRVETAGGNCPATCQGQTGTINVPYAAEYWFYG